MPVAQQIRKDGRAGQSKISKMIFFAKIFHFCCIKQKYIFSSAIIHKKDVSLQTNCNKVEEYNKIGQWIEDLPKRGKSVFSRQEIEKQFPALSYYSIRNSLNRLVKKKKIQSVWRDFYAVILPEYGLKGVAPPIEYIDQLMKFLGNDYYIALLSASALQGASHQAPMEFFVITNS